MKKYYSYMIYLLTSVLVVLLYINDFGPMNNLQRWVNDTLSKLTASEDAKPNVVLVTVDAQAMDKYGNWPWNHDLIADLLAAAAHGDPKTIVVDFPLNENSVQDSAGYTRILAEQLNWIDNAVLPYDIALATFRSQRTNNPEHLFNFSIQTDNLLGIMNEESSLIVRKVFLPADKILETDPMLGFEYVMPDQDRILRHESLVMNFEGYYYPSQTLLAAANYLKIKPDMIKVYENQHIDLNGQTLIPINENGEMYINYSSGNPFVRYSAAQILGENFDYNKLQNKLVMICIDDIGYTEFFQTPVNLETSKYIIKATVIENIINNNLIADKHDMAMITMLTLFILGGICAFMLPQVSNLYRMVILFVGFIILVNINYFLFSSFKIIAETVYIALELFLFMCVSPLLDSNLIAGEQDDKKSKKKLPKIEYDKSIVSSQPIPTREIHDSIENENYQNTEMIDSSSNEIALLGDQQTSGLHSDHAEKTTATPVGGTPNLDDSFVANSRGFEEDDDELIIISTNEENISGEVKKPQGAGIQQPVSPLTQSSIKNLGRYQISGTLGKGAMGHVYKGIDPAIDRPVALKTIRLDFINDPSEMEELKQRLHREAQAVGKLSHPNIVTVYDVGSEGSLQYIAMEYLEGMTLEDMIKKKTKFNYKIISQIIIQICRALEYAHSKDIVHRDIKPANIMILKDYQVKVMDFGIARIDSNSMTKTGIAMGTPNYISPEQLQGKNIDRRSDLFSLGVVMYEMLIGARPFKGENITSLIYAILNKDPEKPSNIKPQVPLLFDHIVDKSLKKNPNERYQSASEIIQDLAEFVEAFSR